MKSRPAIVNGAAHERRELAPPCLRGRRRPPGGPGLLYLVFALSGLTGLVYEATWTRYLQLFLGTPPTPGARAVAVHGRHGGRRAGRSRLSRAAIAPLVAYAAIEAALGVAALLFHPLFDGVTSFAYESLLPERRMESKYCAASGRTVEISREERRKLARARSAARRAWSKAARRSWLPRIQRRLLPDLGQTWSRPRSLRA